MGDEGTGSYHSMGEAVTGERVIGTLQEASLLRRSSRKNTDDSGVNFSPANFHNLEYN
jgi:hypothetical protein